jgi:hypothetical protein
VLILLLKHIFIVRELLLVSNIIAIARLGHSIANYRKLSILGKGIIDLINY